MCYNRLDCFWENRGEKLMKLRRCPVCKVKVPEKTEKCPVCETEYTKFQYFLMNNLSKYISLILAVLIVYNGIVIIAFNRKIRSYVEEPPEDIKVVEMIRRRYERMNFIQKHFVHSSEIEMIEHDFIDERKLENVEGHYCNVQFDKGSIVGEYTGEIYEGVPYGNGCFSYYDDGIYVIYDGEFEDGEITGKGSMLFEDGTKYEGEFESGILDGYGVIYNPAGYTTKAGNFVAGKLNGEGTIYDELGVEIYSGRFASDIPIEGDYKRSCKETTFAELEANTDLFVNKNLRISGVITDIAIQDDMTVYYIISIAGSNHKNICIEYIGAKGTNIRQGDNSTFYGYCSGYRQYMGNTGVKNGGMIIKTYFVE